MIDDDRAPGDIDLNGDVPCATLRSMMMMWRIDDDVTACDAVKITGQSGHLLLDARFNGGG